MKRSAITLSILALLVGLAGGYLIGRSGGGAANGGPQGVKPGAPTALGGAGETGSAAGSATAGDTGISSDPAKARGGLLSAKAAKLLEAGDVEGALDAIFDAPGQMERMEALLEFAKSLDSDGVESALARLRGMPRSMDMFLAGSLLMTRYADIDPKKALDFASNSVGFERMMGTSSILRSWAAKDPQAAGDHFVKNVLGGSGEQWQMERTARSVASEWVRQDPDGALAWSLALPEEVRGDALEGVIEHLAGDDPKKAAEVALTLPEDSQADALESIADQWARTDPAAATAWANSLEGEARDRALEEAMQGWAYNDPAGATAYLEGITDVEEKDGLLPDVASRWARRDTESAAAAADWLTGQSDGAGKTRAMGEVVGTWLRSDPTAASTWLGTQPEGEAKDSGIVALLDNREVRDDPGTATAWAESISDTKLRGEQVYSTAKRWLASDREAAAGYVESTGALNEEQKVELMNMTAEELSPPRRGFRGRF